MLVPAEYHPGAIRKAKQLLANPATELLYVGEHGVMMRDIGGNVLSVHKSRSGLIISFSDAGCARVSSSGDAAEEARR